MVYFSQTGNTRRAAEAMAAAFRDLGHSARTVSLKKATVEHATEGDLVGVGSPCFTGQAPTPIKDFIRSLPRLDNKRAFVFATSGGAPGKVLYDLTRLLRQRGAEVVGGTLIRGECFHPAPCFIGRYPGRPNAEDLARARRFALDVAEHVASGIPGPLAESRGDALKRGWGLYDFEGMFVPDRMVRLVLPKPKLDRPKCDKCEWCAYECPVDNVIMDPYPSIGGRCIRCYRCLTGCRQKALGAGWLLGNLVLLSLHSTILERWFGDLEFDEPIYRDADKPTSRWGFDMLLSALAMRGAGMAASAAARTLGEIGHKRATPALICALSDGRHHDQACVREATAQALGKIGDERATEPLIAALRDENKYVRLAACEALGSIGNERAVDALVLALNDEHWLVREAVASKLGEIGTSQVLSPLLSALEDDSPVVRREARQSLAGIVECDAMDMTQDEGRAVVQTRC
jgi:flavodoxin/ferredoxin